MPGKEIVEHFRRHTNPVHVKLQIEADLFGVTIAEVRDVLRENGYKVSVADYTKAIGEHEGSIDAIESAEEIEEKIAKYKDWLRREYSLQADLWDRLKASQKRQKYYSKKIGLYEGLME